MSTPWMISLPSVEEGYLGRRSTEGYVNTLDNFPIICWRKVPRNDVSWGLRQ